MLADLVPRFRGRVILLLQDSLAPGVPKQLTMGQSAAAVDQLRRGTVRATGGVRRRVMGARGAMVRFRGLMVRSVPASRSLVLVRLRLMMRRLVRVRRGMAMMCMRRLMMHRTCSRMVVMRRRVRRVHRKGRGLGWDGRRRYPALRHRLVHA
jgi:hypothetical protein